MPFGVSLDTIEEALSDEVAVVFYSIVLSPLQWFCWNALIWDPMSVAGCPSWQRYLASAVSWTVFLAAMSWRVGTALTREDGEVHLGGCFTFGAAGLWSMFGACALFGHMIRTNLNTSRRYRDLKPIDKPTYAKFVWYVVFALWAQHVGKGMLPPVAHEVDLHLPNWPQCLNGYKVVLVADTHIGPVVGRSDVEELVSLVAQQDAQLILLAGDVADGPPEMRAKAVEPLLKLNAADGVYFVTGNHDYIHGSTGQDWVNFFHEGGVIEPLMNEKVVLPRTQVRNCGAQDEQSTFQLLGVPDLETNPDLETVWKSTIPSDGPTLLLAHRPNQWKSARELGVDLQLSGHTHGGHALPVAGFIYLANEAIAGRSVWPPTNSQLYISHGVFGWGPRIRMVTSDNSISVLRLHRLPDGHSLSLPSVHDSYSTLVGYLSLNAMLVIFLGYMSSCLAGEHFWWFRWKLVSRLRELGRQDSSLVRQCRS
jgi:predicted MPP superfamily phosphohydrolase